MLTAPNRYDETLYFRPTGLELFQRAAYCTCADISNNGGIPYSDLALLGLFSEAVTS